MTKRIYWKVLFISLLGVPVPLSAGILNYSKYNIVEAIGAHLFFIGCFTLIVAGNDWIRVEMKNAFGSINDLFIKKGIGWIISLLYTIVGSSIVALAWLKISTNGINKENWLVFLFACTFLVAVYNL